MKRVLAFCIGLLALGMASVAITGTATAALPEDCPNAATAPPNDLGPNCEEAETTFTATPRQGGFYKSGFVPSDWRINVQVNAPYVNPGPGNPQPDVLPLKRVDLVMPTDLTFNPKPNMPVCTDAKLGPNSPKSILNQPPAEVIKLCPKSVIGNGTADLFISHKNTPTGPNITDPTLIVFNAGRVASGPNKGQAKIKIHGYSKATTAGIYMEGVLEKSGKLSIAVPPLSNDSAVSRFDLNIPGTTPIKYNNYTLLESAGQDPNYMRAKCSTGTWLLKSDFTLGTRDDAGTPTGPSSELVAPDFSTSCTGQAGSPKAKLGAVKLAGPAKAKRGKKVAYKLTLSNAAFGDVTGIKVTAKGKGAKGSAKGGSLSGTVAKTVTVKVKFTKKGKSKVTFTVKSKNGGTKKVSKKVTVK